MRLGWKFELDQQPIGIGEPLHAGFRAFFAALEIQLYLLFAALNCRKNYSRVDQEDISE